MQVEDVDRRGIVSSLRHANTSGRYIRTARYAVAYFLYAELAIVARTAAS